jgi:hypothetical protein
MTKSELRRRPGQAMNMDQWRTEEATPVRMKTVLKLRCRSASVLRAPLGRVTTGAPQGQPASRAIPTSDRAVQPLRVRPSAARLRLPSDGVAATRTAVKQPSTGLDTLVSSLPTRAGHMTTPRLFAVLAVGGWRWGRRDLARGQDAM